MSLIENMESHCNGTLDSRHLNLLKLKCFPLNYTTKIQYTLIWCCFKYVANPPKISPPEGLISHRNAFSLDEVMYLMLCTGCWLIGGGGGFNVFTHYCRIQMDAIIIVIHCWTDISPLVSFSWWLVSFQDESVSPRVYLRMCLEHTWQAKRIGKVMRE
jgi:hypothetical protein